MIIKWLHEAYQMSVDLTFPPVQERRLISPFLLSLGSSNSVEPEMVQWFELNSFSLTDFPSFIPSEVFFRALFFYHKFFNLAQVEVRNDKFKK